MYRTSSALNVALPEISANELRRNAEDDFKLEAD